MTAESLKPFITLPPGPYEKASTNTKLLRILVVITVFVFCSSLIGFTIWNLIRTTKLEKDVQDLNNLVDNFQKRLGLDIIDDINEFEEAYSNNLLNDEKDDEHDLLDSFEDDDFEEDPDEDFDGSGMYQFDDDSVYDDFGIDKMYDEFGKLEENYEDILETVRKDDKKEKNKKDEESSRKSRSIPSISGVPVIEESYALRRNKTDDQTDEYIAKVLLHNKDQAFDWSEQREFNSRRKPKKYLESRQKPESVVHVPHHELHRIHSQNRVNQHIKHQDFVTPAPNVVPAPNELPSSVQSRQSRVMSTSNDKSKPFRPNIRIMPDGTQVLVHSRRRIRPIHKSMDVRTRQGMSRSRSIAVHYIGDTSRYIPGHHEHYDGNGRLRHPGGVYIDWISDSWANTFGMEKFFKMENGVVTIRENGLYYIYAQIFYHDDHDINSYVVERNSESFLQCTTMTYTEHRITKSNSCFTSGVSYLKIGDTIRIVDSSNHRYVLLEPAKSFFGLIKLGDARHPGLHGHGNGHDDETRMSTN